MPSPSLRLKDEDLINEFQSLNISNVSGSSGNTSSVLQQSTAQSTDESVEEMNYNGQVELRNKQYAESKNFQEENDEELDDDENIE